MTIVTDSTTPLDDLMRALRDAALAEKAERINAPIEAKREADERIQRANHKKLALIHQAHRMGATKIAIARQLGIANPGRVTRLIAEAETLDNMNLNGAEELNK